MDLAWLDEQIAASRRRQKALLGEAAVIEGEIRGLLVVRNQLVAEQEPAQPVPGTDPGLDSA